MNFRKSIDYTVRELQAALGKLKADGVIAGGVVVAEVIVRGSRYMFEASEDVTFTVSVPVPDDKEAA